MQFVTMTRKCLGRGNEARAAIAKTMGREVEAADLIREMTRYVVGALDVPKPSSQKQK